jgi:hypothetical protein
MSAERILAYLRYLNSLKVIKKIDDEQKLYILAIKKPSGDDNWVQLFSDLALDHLCSMTNNKHDKFLTELRKSINESYKKKSCPVINSVVTYFKIDSGRTEELFRWSMYTFIDSPLCPFDIRRNPFIIIK